MMLPRPLMYLVAAVVIATLAACSDSSNDVPGDTSVDTVETDGSSSDVALDATTDVQPDVETDVAPDTEVDAAPDVQIDTPPDVQIDTAVDATSDVQTDVADDVAPDVDPALSCAGRCGAAFVPGAACQCNAVCAAFGNCCDDLCDVCADDGLASCDPVLLSCEGRCGTPFDRDLPCQCTAECADFGNCCDDAATACACVPQCDGLSCGDDGCGGSCGTCSAGSCVDGNCVGACEPTCAGWQDCVGGTCRARSCGSQGQCPGAACFQGTCSDAGSCTAQCATRYGSSHTWACIDAGYCRIVDCGRGTDCGGGVDCVSDSESNTRGPGGAGLFDQTCVSGGSSPCGGTCNGLCSAASGGCSG